MKKCAIVLFLFTFLFCFKVQAGAEKFKVAIMDLTPVVVEMYTDLFIAIGKATGNTFDINVYPPARAVDMLEHKKVDVQVPRVKSRNTAANKMNKAEFSRISLYPVAFVLYTNKEKPLDIASLNNGNTKGYKIEADGSNLNFFNFRAMFSKNAAQSLMTVSAGRIDGYIISQIVGDAFLKALRLKNIKRQFWDNYLASFVLQKGQAGGKLDRILADGVNKLRKNGELEKIMGEDIRYSGFRNWQP